ncbi:MAG: hypothetical protein IJH04_10080 [Eggerthellaceae bacterium]|nr:hypothetical protein [Eggerthellaceae bacterium]
MEYVDLRNGLELDQLVSLAQKSDEPFVVSENGDECLIVMRPAVFERILFDSHIVNIMNEAKHD